MNIFAKIYKVYYYINGKLIDTATVDVYFDMDSAVKRVADSLNIKNYTGYCAEYLYTES